MLARAVAQAVIDLDEHLLISATRLEDVPLRVVADKLGITVPLAAAWRRKAEHRLAEAIRTGELSRGVLDATLTGNRDMRARPDGTRPRHPRTVPA